VVTTISEQKPSWVCYEQIIEDLRIILRSLRRWRIVHVKREANIAAHKLAKEAARKPIDCIWLEEPPNCIFDTIILEQLALFL
jgi:hypothetical protein